MWFQSASHNEGSVLQSEQDLFTKHLMLCSEGLERGHNKNCVQRKWFQVRISSGCYPAFLAFSALFWGGGSGKLFLMDSQNVILFLRVPKPPNQEETCDEPALEVLNFSSWI